MRLTRFMSYFSGIPYIPHLKTSLPYTTNARFLINPSLTNIYITYNQSTEFLCEITLVLNRLQLLPNILSEITISGDFVETKITRKDPFMRTVVIMQS